MRDWILFTFVLCAGLIVGAVYGALYMQRIVKANAEHAVMRDDRVSRDRKAAIIARIRGCPVEWVLEEMEAARDDS